MADEVSAQTVREWLFDGQEIALIDVREKGHHGDGHPLFAVSIPYSVFEARLITLVPNPAVRLVLYDNDNGIAGLAAARAAALGYSNISVMEGGAAAWAAAGYTLYQGMNVPSKAFGELLELQHHTPNLNAEQIAALAETTPNHIIVDSRPYEEYRRFNIPGGICCPNGEVSLRIGELVPDPETTIVVNCAGRTRSILGAETLRAFGVPNPVYAMQNGTQGWLLAGQQREEGATRNFTDAPSLGVLSQAQAKARACADRTGFGFIDATLALAWLSDPSRTTFLFDVRSREEFQADGLPGSRHALGGQLVQATDQYMGVRGSRVILMDNDMVRAPMMANWMHQLGFEVSVLEDGVDALRDASLPELPVFDPAAIDLIEPAAVKEMTDAVVLDVRTIKAFRRGHINGSVWSVRPLLDGLNLGEDTPVLIIATDDVTAGLAAQRLSELGTKTIRRIGGNDEGWKAAGFDVVATSDDPMDADTEAMLYYVHERNMPNSSEAAANAYLDWEIGLVDQLDAQERAAFRLASDHIANA